MRRRSPMAAIGASPTMVGAVTTLIVIVAVFLAYNANAGLPFVPVYRVSVEIPDAARLTNSNEVRIGGHRVGVVESIDAIPADEVSDQAVGSDATPANGSDVIAKVNLKLDKDVGALPVDSIFRVRYRSSFGLKYVEIVRGEGDAAPEGPVPDDILDQILDLPPEALDELPEDLQDQLGGATNQGGNGGGAGGAATDLLDFLFAS